MGLWLLSSVWILGSTQGVYEDHTLIAAMQREGEPSMLQARGLAKWSLWQQTRIAASPVAMRTVNLALAGIVALLTAWLAVRLGLSGWIAGGLMALHPMTVEATAMLNGRFELVAAIGVVAACGFAAAGGVWWRPWRLIAIVACLALGWLGKETAVIGLVLVPLVMLAQSRRLAWGLFVAGLMVVLSGAWVYRHIGLDPATASLSGTDWLLLQSAAAFRLLRMSVAALIPFVPLGQTLDADIDVLSRTVQIVSLVGLVLCGLWASVWLTHRRLALGIAWMVLVCLPRLIVQTPRSYLNEHQFTVALVGLALVCAALVGGHDG